MEFALLTWLYDKRYFFGVPFISKRIVKYCMLFPLFLNTVLILIEEFGDIKKQNCCKGSSSHGCNRTFYQFFVVANIFIIIFMVISAEYAYAKRSKKFTKVEKNNDFVANVYFSTMDYFWTRRLYTHSIAAIFLWLSSFSLALWGLWYILYFKSSDSCSSTLRVQITYYHSMVYMLSFMYCFTIFLLSFLYKAAHTFTHFKFPKLYHSIFLADTDPVVEGYIEDFWSNNKK